MAKKSAKVNVTPKPQVSVADPLNTRLMAEKILTALERSGDSAIVRTLTELNEHFDISIEISSKSPARLDYQELAQARVYDALAEFIKKVEPKDLINLASLLSPLLSMMNISGQKPAGPPSSSSMEDLIRTTAMSQAKEAEQAEARAKAEKQSDDKEKTSAS